jgi:hypothetical protein
MYYTDVYYTCIKHFIPLGYHGGMYLMVFNAEFAQKDLPEACIPGKVPTNIKGLRKPWKWNFEVVFRHRGHGPPLKTRQPQSLMNGR